MRRNITQIIYNARENVNITTLSVDIDQCVLSCPAAGNPWPPVVPKQRDQRNSLVNILLDQARKDYRQQKYESMAALELNKQSEQQTSNIDDSSASTS